MGDPISKYGPGINLDQLNKDNATSQIASAAGQAGQDIGSALAAPSPDPANFKYQGPNLDWLGKGGSNLSLGPLNIPMPDSNPVGDVLGMAGTALSKENELTAQWLAGQMAHPGVVGTVARVVYGLTNPGQSGIAAGLLPGHEQGWAVASTRPDVQQIYNEQGPQAAWNYAKDKGLVSPVESLILEMGLDPMTYVGIGMPGKLAKAAETLGPKAAPLVKGLEGLNAVDQGIVKAGQYPLDLLGKAYRASPLGKPSLEAELSQHTNEVKDAIAELRSLGGKYTGIEMNGDPTLGAWPGNGGAANKAELDLWNTVDKTIAGIKEPLARVRALDVKSYAREAIDRWSTEAGGEEVAQRLAGASSTEIDQIWADRHRKVMQTIQSIGDVAKQFDNVTPLENITVGQQSKASQIVNKLINIDIPAMTKDARQTLQTQLKQRRVKARTNEYQQIADPIFRARNQQIADATQIVRDRIEEIYYPGARAAGQPTFPDTQPWRDVQTKVAEMSSIGKGLPSFFGQMSDVKANTLKNIMPSVDRYAGMVDKDRSRVLKILNDVIARVPGFNPVGLTDGTSLLKALNGVAQPFETEEVQGILAKWAKDGDLLANDHLDLVASRLRQDKAKALGIKPSHPIVQTLNDGVQAWKEETLVSPTFHMTNITGITAMSALKGLDPVRVLRNIGDSMLYLARNREVLPPSEVRNALTQYGRELPNTIKDSGLIMDLLKTPEELAGGQHVSVWSKIGPVKGALLGAALNAGLSVKMPLNVAIGAVKGAAMPYLVQGNKMLASAIESAARSTAWLKEMDGHAKANLGQFIQDTANELARNRSLVGAGGVPTQSAAMQQSAVQNIAKLIKATDGRLSPDRLAEIMTANGAPIEAINAAKQRWMNILEAGDAKGQKLAAAINFDYSQTDKADKFLRYVFPFSFWAKRAFPFFAESLVEHPGFIAALDRYNNVSQEDTKGTKYQAFLGPIKMGGLGEMVAEKILGQKGQMYTNPLSAILPFADVRSPKESGTPVQNVVNGARDLGFGLGPWGSIPLTLMGVMGDKQLPQLSRTSRLTQAITGENPEQGWQSLVNQFRLGQQPTTDAEWLDYSIQKRIEEMSVEDTGKPHQAAYDAALTDKNSPIYQKAAASVQREQSMTPWLNYLSPSYMRMLPNVEQAAGNARAQLPIFPRDQYGNLLVNGQMGDTADQQAVNQFSQALKANPLAETYGKPAAPASATMVYLSVRGYPLMKTSQERTTWQRMNAGGLASSYLYWWKDQGHNIDKGDIGTLQDVQRYLRERGQ